jgi:hypothetical protein
MDDIDRDLLARLAPDVDEHAAHALFDRTRGRRRIQRRVAGAIAAATLASGAIAVAVAVTGDDPVGIEVVPGSPTTSPGGDGPLFELLDLRAGAEVPMGTLRAAVDDAGLAQLWDELGFDGSAPAVEFRRWVVASITIPDDACPPALADLRRDGAVLTPVFQDLTAGCNEPLIPKTYLVLIDRASVTPAFTLRLPADEVFDFTEQRLDVDVPPADTPPNESGDEPTIGPEVARIPLPPAGEARSVLLDDGTPIWVVHHDDGTASAVPAIVPYRDDEQVAGLSSIVQWAPSGAFHGPIVWDAWGRALTAGRAADLTGYVARVDGDEVVVSTATRDRVPGAPTIPTASGAYVMPSLPEPSALTAGGSGWIQVELALVGDGTTFRVCPIDDATVPDLTTCPADAPTVEGLTARDPEITTWHFAPLLLRLDAGAITGVVPLGGLAAERR